MISWFVALFSIILIGIGIGGLFISKRMFPHQLVIFGVAVTFGLAGYLGMLIGSLFTDWMSWRFAEIFVAIVCLLFVALCFMRFHPTLGYFHSEDKGLWGIILLLFLLLGIEWSLNEINRLFIFLATPLFFVAVIAGATLQIHLISRLWKMAYVTFLPLSWLIIIAIIKLL